MIFIYNACILIGLTIANGGRHDWAYDFFGLLLWLNAIPVVVSLVRGGAQLHGRSRAFWVFLAIGPWALWSVLFSYALFNPNLLTIYNSLLSPMQWQPYVEWLPTTPNPLRSLLFTQFIIGLLWMTLALLLVPGSRWGIRTALYLIFFSGATFALIGSIMKLTGNPNMFGLFEMREPIAFGTFFYKNHYAYAAILSAGCGMALFHRVYRREKHTGHLPEKSIGIALLVLLLIISIVLAEARNAALVTIPLAIAFAYSVGKAFLSKKKSILVPVVLVIGAVCAWLILQIAAPQVERSIERSESQIITMQESEEASRGDQRLAAYLVAWEMIQERPLWGWGVGSYIHIHPIYAGPEFYQKGSDLPRFYEFTHSDYLQALAEMGVAGSLLFFTPFGIILMGVHKKAKWRNSIGTWLLGASLAVAAAGILDMTLICPAIATGCLLLGASSVSERLLPPNTPA